MNNITSFTSNQVSSASHIANQIIAQTTPFFSSKTHYAKKNIFHTEQVSVNLNQKYLNLQIELFEANRKIQELENELISVYQNWISENFDSLIEKAKKNNSYNADGVLLLSKDDEWVDEDCWDDLYEELNHVDHR